MTELVQVYSLREDRPYIAAVQRATGASGVFGLAQAPWIFGSAAWWDAIAAGELRKNTIEGTISRVFMSGQGDYPEFEVDDGCTRTCWTRQTSRVPGCTLSRPEMAELYKVGASVRLTYVVQRAKADVAGLGSTSNIVLSVFLGGA